MKNIIYLIFNPINEKKQYLNILSMYLSFPKLANDVFLHIIVTNNYEYKVNCSPFQISPF